jgi:glycosyltransferase involved in cell wall biosynthesis
MARIVFASYMFRYPLGGMMSWSLQYLLGLKALGHDVYFVEKAGYEKSCFDPFQNLMTDDCEYGIRTVSSLFKRFGFDHKWCFVDVQGNYYGLDRQQVSEIFKTADLFIDSGSHGSWLEEAANVTQVLIDGEPGYTQIKWSQKLSSGSEIPKYHHYFTNGKNIGNSDNEVPTLGIKWEHLYSPVDTRLFVPKPGAKQAPYSTVMNWQSHEPLLYNGREYGQKDIEFEKFMQLPTQLACPVEVAVAGKLIPIETLKKNRWIINDAQKVTLSFESFVNYINYCRGEFSVCKNVFVANRTGWFSDKSAAYLASGRPVILQDTGFSRHLPVGEGLFAVNNLEEAKDAVEKIEKDYTRHSQKAREIALEFLDTQKTMKKFLDILGIATY